MICRGGSIHKPTPTLPNVRRIIDAMRNPCTMDSPTISGCSLRIGSAPETRCGHCLSLCPGFLRDPGTCWKARRPGPPRPVPSKLEAALPLGWGEAKDTGCGERSAGNRDKTPSRPAQKGKASFPGRGPLRCAPCSFPAWVETLVRPSRPLRGLVPVSRPLHCPQTASINPWTTAPNREPPAWIRYLVVAVIALFLVWWMLRVYVL